MDKTYLLKILLLVIIPVIFFRPLIFNEKLAMPVDTLVGLYHPFRDLYVVNYPNGIPFKNFLITDPVRQQYPWRELVISIEKKNQLPVWNPYSSSGTPLLANQQSAAFYPLNILFFILPIDIAWNILIILEPILAGLFLYIYLKNLKINTWAAFLGGFVFAFCGFSIAWLEWGTILHVGLWLPLILLAIDKITFNYISLNRLNLIWNFIFIFSTIFSFFAGHLQTFFYLFITATIYLSIKIWQSSQKRKLIILFLINYLIILVLSVIQWLPLIQYILLSARSIDQTNWQNEGWFIPWQNFIQFFAPDFFGNPSTLNYWGTWNYGEFIGYVGILPLLMALYALFFRRDRKTLFFGIIFFISIILSFPTLIAKIPYILNIPFLSTSQPTRLMFLTDFALSLLAAFGLDYFFRVKKQIVYPLIFIILVNITLWFFISLNLKNSQTIILQNLFVARQNLILPTLLLTLIAFFIIVFIYMKSKLVKNLIIAILILITIFDLLRFAEKFTPFSKKDYLYPESKTILFLKNNIDHSRFMSTDLRILPPNFSTVYRLQSIEGYDPLYLRRYGELIAASERKKPDITPPLGFNRIITPHNYDSKIIDLLGVKYVLSLSDLNSQKLSKVFQEGQTRIYENSDVLPRVFFVNKVYCVFSKQEVLDRIFQEDFDFKNEAVIEENIRTPILTLGKADVIEYSENKIIIKTENTGDGFLVLTDSFYPVWSAKIDGSKTKIHITNYNFRGIMIKPGKHIIEFYNTII